MKYEIKMIFGKKCVVENETGFFIILEDIKTQVFAYNYDTITMEQKSTFLHNNSREPVLRIQDWITKKHPEFMV